LRKREKEAGRSDQASEAILERLEGKDFEMKERQKKVYPASRAYEEGLDERLTNPEYAIGYLNAILEENDPDLLLLGLRDVARAYGFTHIAESTGLNRESLYKALSKGRNPRIGTVMDVLCAIGCRIRLEPAKRARRKAA
jgi:probable addiction module antidote protein